MKTKNNLMPNFENGRYLDDEGCSYSNLADYVGIKLLGFCGCGCPEEALEFVGNILTILKNRSEDNRNNKNNWSEWSDTLDELLPKDTGQQYFIMYQLEGKGLTEHGSGIMGSWLEEKGYEVLELINLALEEYEAEND